MVGDRISLRQALGAVSFVDCGDIEVRGLSCDSRTIRRGDLFVALPGVRTDGRDCAADAVRQGASAVLTQLPLSGIGVPQCVVRDVRAAWARLCMVWHQVPIDTLCVTGITGTNGKTTCTWLLRSILQAAGHATGLLGTIEYNDGRASQPAALTTPDAAELARLFSRMTQHRTRHCVMEISSHAIDQRRCHAVPLSAAAITNITQDHFDYHGTAEHYRRTKARIANLLKSGAPLLVGVDDPGCRRVLDELPSETTVITFGLQSGAVLQGSVLARQGDITRLQLQLQGARLEVCTPLAGRHNLQNCLAAAGLAEQLGVHPDQIVAGLEQVRSVPGRMERISAGQDFEVYVDYAHTPDGLRHCLQTVREQTPGRVICVFGAGGDRDRQKRPLMAQATESADIVIVTSDNPRSEHPALIISEIMAGFRSLDHVQQDPDRAAAIRRALQLARSGDSVVIAGRGHESMQQIGARQICFDDRRVARRLLQEQLTLAHRDRTVTRSPADDRSPLAEQIPA